MPFTPIAGKYSPHMDVSMHPVTGIVSITVAFHINGGANCRLYELAPPYTGQPVLKRDWIQGQNNVLGPFGHGASLVLPTGALLVAVPAGLDGANNVTPTILLEPGYAPPFALGTGGGGTIDPRVDALALQIGALGQQITAIETALGNIGTGGGLSAEESEALRRLKVWMGLG